MNESELHDSLREVVAIGRRGGYDNDEIAEKLARVAQDYAAVKVREADPLSSVLKPFFDAAKAAQHVPRASFRFPSAQAPCTCSVCMAGRS